MEKVTKNDIKEVIKIVVGFGIWVALVHIIPDGSLAQTILGITVAVALFAAIIWFSPLGNPLKRWLRKRKEKKAQQ